MGIGRWKKVVVQVKSQEELFEIYELVKAAGLPSFLVKDAGHTELPPLYHNLSGNWS
jgi:PTH2 family peptidyl-tRNA hydrolase